MPVSDTPYMHQRMRDFMPDPDIRFRVMCRSTQKKRRLAERRRGRGKRK